MLSVMIVTLGELGAKRSQSGARSAADDCAFQPAAKNGSQGGPARTPNQGTFAGSNTAAVIVMVTTLVIA
jgi:hypothetical protein